MELLFTKPKEEYTRDLQMEKHYLHDAATFLSISKGLPYDVCYDKVKAAITKGGQHEMKDPRVIYLAKETEGNRELYTGTMSGYLKTVAERKCIMSPTMAVYFHPEEKKSLLSEYILLNLAKRKHVKKKMFECEMAGDEAGKNFFNILQTTYKVKNNSLSGAHASASTPLFNKSSHSTLTAGCRVASGTANASNERYITGNYHYYNVDVALANITSIIGHSDYPAIGAAMDEFSLVYPSAEDMLMMIKRSTDLYWRSDEKFALIENYVGKLTAEQRAAFCYTGNLWSLKEFNPDFTRTFLTTLVTKRTEPVADPKAVIKALDADQFALVGLFCGGVLNGNSIGDVISEGGERLQHVGSVAYGVVTAIGQFRNLYKAFWVTNNVPASLADFPSSVRRTAVVSDTDSTIFTVQDWTIWYTGKLDFSETSNDVASIVVYFTSQLVKHFLAVSSGNMGIVSDKIHNISMKNEYMFPVFALTPRAKHYYAYMSAREGNVYLKPEMEIKGVTLKNSKVPDEVMSGAIQLIRDIMDTVLRGELIDLQQILKDVADRERGIYDSIMAGETRYLTTAQVKAPEFYANPESSPYAHYVLWESVFADKYGHSDKPPFFAIKASVTTTNKSKFQEWINSLEDRGVAERLTTWATQNERQHMTTIMLPATIVQSGGVPPEITRVIDVRKIIYNTMESYYLVLESLGYYINVDDRISNLISDRH